MPRLLMADQQLASLSPVNLPSEHQALTPDLANLGGAKKGAFESKTAAPAGTRNGGNWGNQGSCKADRTRDRAVRATPYRIGVSFAVSADPFARLTEEMKRRTADAWWRDRARQAGVR